jgi:hypothetical protein
MTADVFELARRRWLLRRETGEVGTRGDHAGGENDMVISNTWRRIVGRLLVRVETALHRLNPEGRTGIPSSRSVHSQLPEVARKDVSEPAHLLARRPLILTIDQLRKL